jgi:protein TonB
VAYPASLFAARVNGTVIAEFVVDTAGHVEDGSFCIVSSTDPLFSEAVREAVRGATYTPAIRRGTPVRQVVQQPFDFTTQANTGPRG